MVVSRGSESSRTVPWMASRQPGRGAQQGADPRGARARAAADGLVLEIASGTGQHARALRARAAAAHVAAERPGRPRARVDRGVAASDERCRTCARRSSSTCASTPWPCRARRRGGVHQHDPHRAVGGDARAAARAPRAMLAAGRARSSSTARTASTAAHRAEQRGVRREPARAESRVGRARPGRGRESRGRARASSSSRRSRCRRTT